MSAPRSTRPPTAQAAIGVDLGGTKIEAIVLDRHGSEQWRERVVTPTGDYAGTVAAVSALVLRAERESGFSGCSVGIGAPGTSAADGLMRNANSTCLNGQPLAADLAAALDRPVTLANDANCLALSEATDGAAAGAGVVFAVILGTGVGGGIVVDGRVLNGPHGLAGEWGHNPLPWRTDADPDLPCYCGRSGCIETLLAGPALSRDHQRHAGRSLPPLAMATAATAGDADCEATLVRYESRLARALAQVINLLDPDVIVLGGGVSNLPRLVDHVPLLWSRHVFASGPLQPVRTPLVRSRYGDSSGVRGAAWLGVR